MLRRKVAVICTACMVLSIGFWATAKPESVAQREEGNLIANAGMEQRDANNQPAEFRLTGAAEYRYLGDSNRDMSSYGVAFDSSKNAGSVNCIATRIDARSGRWFRFSFRGLPQANFSVESDDLAIKVAFFGDGGKTSFDEKRRKIFDQIREARRDLSINGVHGRGGAEVWRTYTLDFMLPFPQIDTLNLSVEFNHGNAKAATNSEFFVDDFRLERIPDPSPSAGDASPATRPVAIASTENLIPIGGRWFYAGAKGETLVPKKFDHTNADRLVYHDDIYSAPFAGNTSAWLRPGNMDRSGNVLTVAKLVDDNVTIEFDSTSMIVHSHNIPTHPTGRFPEQGFGNPSYIEEQNETFYIPIDPRENPSHKITTPNNSNHALNMGPIGIAINGVVFFNPFDMGNTVAVDMMDRCCGHPNQDGQYHYHKYPVCVNTPFADEGDDHSPLIGWAFDGYPLYGPYESKDVMAKDVTGAQALSGFNMHYDEARGWHYHVTPGKFPFLIGGYWGAIDPRDTQRPRGGPGGGQGGPGGNRNGPPGGGMGGGRRGGPPGGGPPPGR